MSKFAVRDITDVTFWKKDVNGIEKPALFLNSLKMNTIEGTSDMVMVKGGRGNGVYGVFESNKEVKFTLSDSLLDPKMQAITFGSGIATLSASDKEIIYKREVFTIPQGATGAALDVTLSQIPVSATDVSVFKSGDSVSLDVELTNVGAGTPTTANDFKVTTATKKVTFAADLVASAPATVTVYYKYEITSGERYVVDSAKFTDCVFKVTMDGFYRDVTADGCAVDVPVQVIIPRIKIMSKFKLEFKPDGDPMVFDLEVMALKPFNGTELMKIIRY